jgi:phage gpG-like protein
MLTVDYSGFSGIFSTLEQLQSTPLATEVADAASAAFYRRLKWRFLQKLDSSGTKWPVSEAALIRAAKGIGGGTLYDTGNLYKSIQLYSISPTERSIGTDVEYAGWMNDGTRHPFNPPREFMGVGEDDITLVRAVVTKVLQNLTL